MRVGGMRGLLFCVEVKMSMACNCRMRGCVYERFAGEKDENVKPKEIEELNKIFNIKKTHY